MKLDLGEVQCDKCSGKGYSNKGKIGVTCPKCYGLGKLDWIDNIKGSNETFKNSIIDTAKECIHKETKKLSLEISKVSTTIDKAESKLKNIKKIFKEINRGII